MNIQDPAPPAQSPESKPRYGIWGILDLVFIVLSYGCILLSLVVLVSPAAMGRSLVIAIPLYLAAVLGLAVLVIAILRGRSALRAVREFFILGPLIVWGLILNHVLSDSCVLDPCGDKLPFRPLAEPHVGGLAVLYLVTVLAYVLSRLRPEAQHRHVEALLNSGLLVGAILQAVLGVQFLFMLNFVAILPLTYPVVAPYLALALFVLELVRRLRRRGNEALEAAALSPNGGRPGIAGTLVFSPLLLGLYVVGQAAVFGGIGAGLDVFTATCGHPLSRLAVVIMPPHDCHYLCTIAAQGHPWLVRPERLGRRGSQTILVNRQLAVANAFEDLLHERWPRFGRWARTTYDRFGLPLSLFLRRRWVADLVYLAMKPAEWGFLTALLLLDRASPEARITRMYRG